MSGGAGPSLRDRSILDALPDALILVDVRGDIVYLNRRARRAFGLASDAVQGKPVELLIAEEDHARHREHRRTHAVSPDVNVVGPPVDLQARRSDGTTFPVEVTVSTVVSAGTTLYCAVVRDLSEVRERESILCSLLAATPDALVMVDDGGQIVAVNARVTEFFGYPPEELVGEPVEILVAERLATRHAGRRAGYLAAPHPRAIDAADGLLARRRDGSEFPVDISLTPVRTKDGMHVFAAIRDVSDRVAAQQEADRRQQEFFATVSHELRTPLTSIIGYAELLMDMSDLDGDTKRFLEVITRNARRELRLVDDMLTLVAVQEGRLSIARAELELVSTVSDVVEAFTPQAASNGVELELDTPEAPVLVNADRDRIEQAVGNLVSNAMKFTPPGGRVRVRVVVRDGRAHVDVLDTGCGISASDVGRVFERGFRSRSAVAGEVPGAGLGLTIARAIVESHDGSLDLVTTSERGTTFRIELPIL